MLGGHFILVLVTLVTFLNDVNGETNAFFLSVEDVRKAISIDLKITKFLQKRVNKFKDSTLKETAIRYLQEAALLNNVSEWILLSSPDSRTSVQNFIVTERSNDPLNSFQTMRRLTLDVAKLNILLANHTLFSSFIKAMFLKRSATLEDDVTGTATSIFRLQKSYMILSEQLVRGEIRHIRSPVRLTVSDCLLLGQIARQHELYDFYVEWTEQAHEICLRLPPGGACQRVTESLLATAVHEHDEKWNYVTNESVDDGETVNRKTVFSNETKGMVATKLRRLQWEGMLKGGAGYSQQQALCNGHSLMVTEEESKLTCYYLKREIDPSLTMYRYRVEQRSMTPEVVQIHDFIDADTAILLRTLAETSLEPSRVGGTDNHYGDIDTHSRLSSQAWFYDSEYAVVEEISKRIARVTGLSLANAEALQVASYGTGGHYDGHHDFVSEDQDQNVANEKPINDRFATFLIYLNEVELGGYTVFISANVTIRPSIGSALFWYNLDAICRTDDQTLHSGCPVLYGEKWIANKWIQQNDQMFVKPCPLTMSDTTLKI